MTKSSRPFLRAISKGIIESRKPSTTARMITFVKEGEQPMRKTNLLFTAQDWWMKVDLKIPANIIQTTLRPGVILVSESTKQFILLELTVP